MLSRYQANCRMATLLAVSKTDERLFHILEPLKCSLRTHAKALMREVTLDVDRFKLGRELLVQLLEGLDYLHSRGWVHFDVVLDAIGVRYVLRTINLCISVTFIC